MRYFHVVIAMTFCLAGGASAGMIGHEAIDRATQDAARQITIIDTLNASPFSGQLTTWSLWAKQTGPVKLQVFRSVIGGYELVGENPVTVADLGANSFDIALASQITVQVGDLLGFRYNETYNQGIIAVDLTGSEMFCTHWPEPADDVAVGGVIPLGHMQSIGGRTYSLSADIVPEPATMGLLALGGLAMIRRRRAAR